MLWISPLLDCAVHVSSIIIGNGSLLNCALCVCVARILGTTEVQLQEVVSRGKHSVTKTLKGKKGDMLTVSAVCSHYIVPLEPHALWTSRSCSDD